MLSLETWREFLLSNGLLSGDLLSGSLLSGSLLSGGLLCISLLCISLPSGSLLCISLLCSACDPEFCFAALRSKSFTMGKMRPFEYNAA